MGRVLSNEIIFQPAVNFVDTSGFAQR